MLWFIGIGIYDISSLNNMILNVLSSCDKIYLEKFTSLISDEYFHQLQSISTLKDKEILMVKRWFVEDGRQILEESKNSNVALISYGDSMLATTFVELRTRAVRSNIAVKVIHGTSGITSSITECGLQIYRIGKIVTMMEEIPSAISVYNTLFNNLRNNSHTVILTEYRYSADNSIFYLGPQDVITKLLEIEKDIRYGIVSTETFMIVASRIGSQLPELICGKAESLINIEHGSGPHTIIIPAKLHFTEEEAISSLTKVLDKPTDNTLNVESIASMMIGKYVPLIRNEIEKTRLDIENKRNKYTTEILENAEYYIDDAIDFFKQGKYELAILSIGYADGLTDSIRHQFSNDQ